MPNNISDEIVAMIAELVIKELGKGYSKASARSTRAITVGVSARHVHLNRQALEALYGSGYELHKKSELMGGQYSCEERVTIVGANLRAIENVRILGPLRSATQVEVAETDAVRLGLRPPVRESGNLKDSAPITLIGPLGAVYLNNGCIIAMRHIHMSDLDAELLGVCDRDIISVEFDKSRAGILHNVLIRVDKSYTLEMHIDTDEANALGIKTGDLVHCIA